MNAARVRCGRIALLVMVVAGGGLGLAAPAAAAPAGPSAPSVAAASALAPCTSRWPTSTIPSRCQSVRVCGKSYPARVRVWSGWRYVWKTVQRQDCYWLNY